MMMFQNAISLRAKFSLHLTGFVILVALWSLLTYGGFVRTIFLPAPGDVVLAFMELYRRGWLLAGVLNSLTRILIALTAALLVGVPFGFLMGVSARFDALTVRIIHAIKSIPITGLIGLIILWFGFNELGKISFLFIGIVFYMIVLVRNAVLSVSPTYIKVALGLGATPIQVMSRVILPAALPQIWDAIVICNGLCWTYIVLAEFVGASESRIGLGYVVYISSRTQNSALLFAALVLIAMVSSFSEYSLILARRRFLNW